MTIVEAIVLFLAAAGGGALNSVAGGGSFLTFPTLLFTGVPPILANATSTVALWPGSIASASAYRREIQAEGRQRLIWLSIISLIGGYAGARLLLNTPEDAFEALVPWLLLVATAVFAFGGPTVAKLRERRGGPAVDSGASLSVVGMLIQLVIATYGGFFGGGIGILMLAGLAITGMANMHAMNGVKNWLATCINGIAVVTFVIAGAVLWPQAIVMLFGAIAGGYGGASAARRLDPKLIRRFVILVGTVLTIYFFVREYVLTG
jgi:hypothetical protein